MNVKKGARDGGGGRRGRHPQTTKLVDEAIEVS